MFQIIEQIENLNLNVYLKNDEEDFEVEEMVIFDRYFLLFQVKFLINHYYDHDEFYSIHNLFELVE